MTSKQLIKKAERLIKALKQLADECAEARDNLPPAHRCNKAQCLLGNACEGVEEIARKASEDLFNSLDYYCNYWEGYAWSVNE